MKAISKSQYNLSLQCPKAFWLYRHRRDLQVFSASQKKVMRQGTSFGEYMQGLFPGGTDINQEVSRFGEKIELTKVLLEKATHPIYEATLSCFVEGAPLLCMVDILVPGTHGWHIYEVKSSTSVKPEYLTDVAFQKYVAEQMGLTIESANVIHVNNQYERLGPIEIQKLGVIANVDQAIQNLTIDFTQEVLALKALDRNGQPNTSIGTHCNKPYTCGFKNHCWKEVPVKDSVFDLFPETQAFELFNQGFLAVQDIPDRYPFSGKALDRFTWNKKKELHINSQEVNQFLGQIQYPLSFLDFESFMSAIPKFDNSRPYQQICFQYSLHIQREEGGELEHTEFLDNAIGLDTRIPFIKQLIKDIGTIGSIVVYNASFERKRLEEIGENFPQYNAACQNIAKRMIDLYVPFRDLSVYHPDMKGSASIKSVLPALIPDLNYADLEVGDGGQAMQVFENMLNGVYNAEETQSLRKALLKYCALDTWAMVKLLEWLRNSV